MNLQNWVQVEAVIISQNTGITMMVDAGKQGIIIKVTRCLLLKKKKSGATFKPEEGKLDQELLQKIFTSMSNK